MTLILQNEITEMIELILGHRSIGPDDLLIEGFGAESADIANIVVVLENKYRIHVPEARLAALKTPRDFFSMVRETADG